MADINSFDQRSLGRIAAVVRRVERMRDDRRGERSNRRYNSGGGSDLVSVRLTGNATLRSLSIAWGGGAAVSSPVAWTYSATQVTINTSTGVSADVSGGQTWVATNTVGGSTPQPLFNEAEFNATTTAVGGTAVASTPFPTGFRALAQDAIATTQAHAQDVVVDVRKVKNSAGADIWVFNSPVRFGGSCT